MSDLDLENLKQLSLPNYAVSSDGKEWINELKNLKEFEDTMKSTKLVVIHFAATWDMSSMIASPKFVALALISPKV